MKKVIRLTESDLTRIVKRVINEQLSLSDLGKLPTGDINKPKNVSKNVSKKGSIKDIANKNFKNKEDFNHFYKMTQEPNTTWVIVSSTGDVKVAGVSKNLSGKQLKSSDFIDLTNGGEITLKPKNKEINAVMYIQLGRNGSIESGMVWD